MDSMLAGGEELKETALWKRWLFHFSEEKTQRLCGHRDGTLELLATRKPRIVLPRTLYFDLKKVHYETGLEGERSNDKKAIFFKCVHMGSLGNLHFKSYHYCCKMCAKWLSHVAGMTQWLHVSVPHVTHSVLSKSNSDLKLFLVFQIHSIIKGFLFRCG